MPTLRTSSGIHACCRTMTTAARRKRRTEYQAQSVAVRTRQLARSESLASSREPLRPRKATDAPRNFLHKRHNYRPALSAAKRISQETPDLGPRRWLRPLEAREVQRGSDGASSGP
jgi:hypothetical protein